MTPHGSGGKAPAAMRLGGTKSLDEGEPDVLIIRLVISARDVSAHGLPLFPDPSPGMAEPEQALLAALEQSLAIDLITSSAARQSLPATPQFACSIAPRRRPKPISICQNQYSTTASSRIIGGSNAGTARCSASSRSSPRWTGVEMVNTMRKRTGTASCNDPPCRTICDSRRLTAKATPLAFQFSRCKSDGISSNVPPYLLLSAFAVQSRRMISITVSVVRSRWLRPSASRAVWLM